MTKRTKTTYILILLFSLLVISILIFRSYNQYHVWKDHKDYFEHPHPKIESWMTVNLIINRFHVNETKLFLDLNISDDWNYRRKRLDEIFDDNDFNMTLKLKELNELLK